MRGPSPLAPGVSGRPDRRRLYHAGRDCANPSSARLPREAGCKWTGMRREATPTEFWGDGLPCRHRVPEPGTPWSSIVWSVWSTAEVYPIGPVELWAHGSSDLGIREGRKPGVRSDPGKHHRSCATRSSTHALRSAHVLWSLRRCPEWLADACEPGADIECQSARGQSRVAGPTMHHRC